MFTQKFNHSFLEQLKVVEVVLKESIYGFLINIPIQMNQSVAKSGHFYQPLREIMIHHTQPTKLFKNIRIGIRRRHRFRKLR